MRPLEDFIGRVPQEMIDKYGPRLAMVLQQGCVPGYASQGDRISGTARAEQVIDAFESEAGLGGLRDKDDQFH